jgi:hypothetical protein
VRDSKEHQGERQLAGLAASGSLLFYVLIALGLTLLAVALLAIRLIGG